MDNNSFFSVDRLVEFGLGMAMAQQMVGMMNQTMLSSQTLLVNLTFILAQWPKATKLDS